ncbi:hypothetical protein [Microbacterium oxydans]|uniref:hypothetical protein n=1 Tax=Microbacterium oxydans TaxID=82380 RepID=UPI00226B080C|nr:hypothetical protein [Microbacterium oxydans]WAA65565.1 hypothetical protein MME74_15215 [Microbacterium oxydans]
MTAAVTAIGGLLLLSSTMTGCTGEAIATPGPTETSSASPQAGETAAPAPTPIPTPTPAPADVVHYVPDGEDILASVDNQQAANQIGVFPVTHKNAVVYLTCTGEGMVVIEIAPLGTFSLECAATVASENQFQVSEYDEFRVGIRSIAGQTWAATITTRD